VPGLTQFRIVGSVPPEVWNRLGTKVLAKLRAGSNLEVGVSFSVMVRTDRASPWSRNFGRSFRTSDWLRS